MTGDLQVFRPGKAATWLLAITLPLKRLGVTIILRIVMDHLEICHVQPSLSREHSHLAVGLEDELCVFEPPHIGDCPLYHMLVFVDAFHWYDVREHALRVAVSDDQALHFLTTVPNSEYVSITIRRLGVILEFASRREPVGRHEEIVHTDHWYLGLVRRARLSVHSESLALYTFSTP
jgi:hypothetical protein